MCGFFLSPGLGLMAALRLEFFVNLAVGDNSQDNRVDNGNTSVGKWTRGNVELAARFSNPRIKKLKSTRFFKPERI